jgi:predicted ATPase/class 3 adenylate cyclase
MGIVRDLPTGTVTFLFSDVEGSTKLLHELGPRRYAKELDKHRRVLREAFERHGGVEVDTQGDAFFVVFPTTACALAAAAAGQEALSISVRMGLHTGDPLLTEAGYVGPEVHEAARICGVAHGGQIVLSQRSRAAVGTDEGLRDLGLHRLKDVPDPVRLYQLGERDFPPLRSLNATNLPALPNPLVARRRELDDVTSMLQDGARLITLTGPGGTGKTRLALEVATELTGEFPDGVFWAPLASVRDPALAIHAVEEAIGAKTALAEHIDERRVLLLLDNFEQLLSSAPEVGAVLERCPNLKLLVTSRAPLRLAGEHEFEVRPLTVTDAATLFVQRARAVRTELKTDEAVEEICRRLDGLPLAIELAAARVRIFETHELLARLDQRLPVLTGGPRDVPERQRTLRSTIAWSFDLLSSAEQSTLARVAVFAGGWSAEAAEGIADAGLEQLDLLAEQSLIRFDRGRFFMLETIREFALERLCERGEEEALRHRHALYFVARAEELGPRIAEAHGRERLAALEEDSANITSALIWLVDNSEGESALRLIGGLRLFWILRGRARVVRKLIERALALNGSVAPATRARALGALATLIAETGDLQRTSELEERAQQLFEQAGESYGIGRTLLTRAWLAIERNDLGVAEELARKGMQIAEESDHVALRGLAYNWLAAIARTRGDLDSARALYERALRDWRESGNELGVTGALANLAAVSLVAGDLDRAQQLAEQALELNRAIPYEVHAVEDLLLLGKIAILREDRGEAAAHLTESLAMYSDLGYLASAIECIELLAATFPADHAEEAAAAWGSVAAFRERFALPPPDEMRDVVEDAIENSRAELGAERFQEACAKGLDLPIEDAIERALAIAEEGAHSKKL